MMSNELRSLAYLIIGSMRLESSNEVYTGYTYDMLSSYNFSEDMLYSIETATLFYLDEANEFFDLLNNLL